MEVILGEAKDGLISGSTIVYNGITYIGVTHQCKNCKKLFHSNNYLAACPDKCEGLIPMRKFGEEIIL